MASTVLAVARLWAVYFGAAAAGILLVRRYVSPVATRSAILIAFAPFLLVGRAMWTAGVFAPLDIAYQVPPLSVHAAEMGTEITQTPILGDVVTQEIPWRKAVREAVKNGRLPLWNRFVLGGEPLLAVQQPVVFHPATWIGFLLPLAHAWTFEMALRLFLALLFGYLFLRELDCSEVTALLGGAAWAFSDYLVFFLGYPLTPAAAPLPLLLLGLKRLVTRRDRRAVGLTTIALLLILTSGHPETLLHCVAGGGIFFLLEIAAAPRGARLRPVLLSLAAGALALALGAVLLLPLAEALPQTWEHFYRTRVFAHQDKSMPVLEGAKHASLNVFPYLFGVSGKGEAGVAGFHEPSSYAGSLLWPFAILGLFLSRRRERWALLLLLLLGLAMYSAIPGIVRVVSAVPFFDIGLNTRMVFLAAFAAACLAALGAEEVLRRRREKALSLLAVAIGLLTLAAGVWRLRHAPSLHVPADYFRYRLALQSVPLLLLAAASFLPVVRRRTVISAASVALVLLLVERGLEERDLYPTYPSRAFYPPLACFEKIPRGAPWRMTALEFSFIPNVSALYELEDVRGYEAMTFRPFFEIYPLWCVHQSIWFNRVDDPTRPFLSFLNVRWVYAPPHFRPPSGWPVLYRGPEGALLENPKVLPRAFVPRELAYEPEQQRRRTLLAAIPDFAARGIVGETPPSTGTEGSWSRNGEASVEITSYLPQLLTFDVDAREAAFVGTSVTAWTGWKLTIDGRRAELLSYNHAFLGFRVAPGRHTAVLRYWPDSLSAGIAVSGATLLLCVYLFWRRPSRRTTSPNVED